MALLAYLILGITLAASLIYVYERTSPSPPAKPAPRFEEKNAEIVKVLLGLEEERLKELFRLYQEEFGPGAARYAHHTYRQWKAGEVRPNQQTFSRLLIHLPKVMSFDLKCEVLRKLREEYCSKENYRVTVDTRNWKETLTPLVTSMIEKTYTAELPKHVAERLSWLSGQEMQVARSLLAESQARESRNAFSLLQQEFSNIERLLANTRGIRRVTHLLKFPSGTITMKIKRR